MQDVGEGSAVIAVPRRAIGYFRTDDGADDDRRASLLAQQQAFFVFCNKAGFEPCATFVETDNARRGPASTYHDMLDHLRRDEAGITVMIPDLDVFGSKADDVAIAVLELEDLGAKVRVIDGQAVDAIAVVMEARPKAAQGQDIRERIKSGMRSRAMRGEGLGKPPYGYKIGDQKKLEVQPKEAETVKLIFTLYTQRNMGIRLIVRHLNENGIPTRKGRNWSMVTIRDILRNRAYLGTYTRFGMRVPGSHPAIITPDMFRWAQTRLDERKPKRRNGQAEPFLLSGLIYCGYCGNRMVGVTRKQSWTRRKDGSRAEKQYRYYQCQSRTNQSVCQYHTRRAQEFENDVFGYVKAQRPRLAALKGRRTAAAIAESLEKERQKLESAQRNVERRLRQSLQNVAAGALSHQRFRPLSAQLIRTRRELEERLLDLDKRGDGEGDVSPGQQAALTVDRLSAEWDTLELMLKRSLLQSVVESVTVYDDRFDMQFRLI
ncbi:MAG: recombinase family protein [Dehalococcoidia bacterium]